MSAKTTNPKPIPAKEHIDAATKRQRDALVTAIQAPDPGFNITFPEALAIVAILRRFGMNPGPIAACQMGGSNATQFREMDELKQLGIDDQTPLFLHVSQNGDWHELAPLRDDFTTGEFHNVRFHELWADLEKGNPTPSGSAIMNVDGRRTAAAVERILLEVIREEWANIPVASRTN